MIRIVKRSLSLLEYESYKMLQLNGLNVPEHVVVSKISDVEQVIKNLQDDIIIKAQVPTGGRGKGSFSSGLKSGVVIATKKDAKKLVSSMLGHRLVTAQTSKEGVMCNHAMIAEVIPHDREFYISVSLIPGKNKPLLLFSLQGGVEIEGSDTTNIVKLGIDMRKSEPDLLRAAELISDKLGIDKKISHDFVSKLFQVFLNTDAILVEVNPGTITEGKLLCLDAKINVDDNALYKHKNLETEDETTVSKNSIETLGMSFVKLDGDIACLVNGAGLSMATMDLIKIKGGNPANFLDIGGTAKEQQIVQALDFLNEEKEVKVILVNVFGGIIKCDAIARAIIKANISKPIVLRLQGTNSDEARELIFDAKRKNLKFVDDMEKAAEYAVTMTKA